VPLATRAPLGLLAALLAIRLVDESVGFLPSGTFEAFRRDLGLTYAQASAVLAAAAPGAIVGNVFAIAADYVSRRVLASGGAFGVAASMGLFAAGHSFAALAVASFLYGMSATAMIDAGELALVDVAGDELAPTLARANLLGAIGDLLGPLAIIVMTAVGLGWRAPFAVAAVVTAAYGVWLATLPLPPPVDDHEREHPARALLTVTRDRRVWFYAGVALLLGPLDEPFLAFLIAFARDVRSLSSAAAVAIAMCSVAGSVVGFARRTSSATATPLVRPATVMAAAAVVLVVLPWPLTMAAAAFVFGLGLASFWNTAQAQILQLRPGQTGTVKAVITTIEFAAFGLPIAYGAVADAMGVAAGLSCYAATAIALALLSRWEP
jgi:predicted MFS family arabinose efflux permease